LLASNSLVLSLFGQAEKEISAHAGHISSEDFYNAKLSAVWNRVREATAYRGLEVYSRTAFDRLAATSKDALKRRPWDYVVADLDHVAKYYETTGTSGTATPTPRTVEDIVWNTVSVAAAWQGRLAGPRGFR
jgi:phenylacetate-CoA ligase